jgi:Bacterial toxin 5
MLLADGGGFSSNSKRTTASAPASPLSTTPSNNPRKSYSASPSYTGSPDTIERKLAAKKNPAKPDPKPSPSYTGSPDTIERKLAAKKNLAKPDPKPSPSYTGSPDVIERRLAAWKPSTSSARNISADAAERRGLAAWKPSKPSAGGHISADDRRKPSMQPVSEYISADDRRGLSARTPSTYTEEESIETPKAAPEKPEEKSLLSKVGKAGGWVKDKASDAGEITKDFGIGVGKGAWDAGEGTYILMKEGIEYKIDTYANPEKAEQTRENFGRNAKYLSHNPSQVWNAFIDPSVKAWKGGHPGEAVGRIFFDVGTMVIPGGAALKAGKAGEIATEIASTTAKLNKLTPTVKAVNKADNVVKPVRLRVLERPFRNEAASVIRSNPSHPLSFTLTDKGKLISDVHAGHQSSLSSGKRQMLALEDKRLNLKDPTGRRKSIEIDGVPVEVNTAKLWEAEGRLPKGTVNNASSHPGWVREAKGAKGIKVNSSGLKAVADKLEWKDLSRLREISHGGSAFKWQSRNDRELYRRYTQALRDSAPGRK